MTMKTYEATEQAYKNGYAKGYEDGKRDAVKHGRWEYNGEVDCDGNLQANCSCCGAGDKHAPCMVGNVPYCWKCGAKMDLPQVTEQTKNALYKMGEKAHGGEK